jgi:hypothetical protein
MKSSHPQNGNGNVGSRAVTGARFFVPGRFHFPASKKQNVAKGSSGRRIIRAVMRGDIADALLEVLGDALKRVAECELKLNALEEVLEKQNAALCAAWQEEVQSITREGHEPNLGKLREKLVLAA